MSSGVFTLLLLDCGDILLSDNSVLVLLVLCLHKYGQYKMILLEYMYVFVKILKGDTA